MPAAGVTESDACRTRPEPSSRATRGRSGEQGATGYAKRAVARIRASPVRRAVAVAVAIAGVSAAVMAVTAASLSSSTPSWWQPVSADDPSTREAAVAVENALGTHLHRVRDVDPWRMAIRAQDATAWLNTRLGEWLISQGAREGAFHLPSRFDEMQVRFADGQIIIGVRLSDGLATEVARAGASEGARYVTAALTPRLDDEGQLWLPVSGVRIGRMPVPTSWALAQADFGNDGALSGAWRHRPEAQAVFRVLAGEIPVPEPARVRLADGRVVRVVDVVSSHDRLTLTCVTERE